MPRGEGLVTGHLWLSGSNRLASQRRQRSAFSIAWSGPSAWIPDSLSTASQPFVSLEAGLQTQKCLTRILGLQVCKLQAWVDVGLWNMKLVVVNVECVEVVFQWAGCAHPWTFSWEFSLNFLLPFPSEPFLPVPIPLLSAEGSHASICWTIAEHSLYALGWVRYGNQSIWSSPGLELWLEGQMVIMRERWTTMWVERDWVICFVSETLGNGLSSSLHSWFFTSLHFKESGV